MATEASFDNDKQMDDLAIKNFAEYIKIPSVHPNPDYTPCIEFVKNLAVSMQLQFRTFTFVPGKPIALITVPGTDPSSPSILLNSHMDVVPVFEDKWKYKPFGAHIDSDQNLYGRGTQDMKSVGIQYVEAIRRLKKNGVVMKRTVHISFVPDEEIGGYDGMKLFVESKQFKELNVGFGLDEGIASPDNSFLVFYGERCIWHLHIHCKGQPGHGSLLLENTAGEKVNKILNKVYEFRAQEAAKLKNDPNLTIGDVTTLNLTIMKGGLQANVIPVEFLLVVDCRLPVTVDHAQWEKTLHEWCRAAGDGVTVEFPVKAPPIPATKLDETNPFWIAFKDASDKMSLELRKGVFTGGTDCRYVREAGIPAIGFSPINNTPVLLHDNDEYLNVKTFLRGISMYCKIIKAVADV